MEILRNRELAVALIEALRVHGEAKISGIGTFTVKKTKPRAGRNPRSGEAIQIPAGRKVAFKITGALKKAVLK